MKIKLRTWITLVVVAILAFVFSTPFLVAALRAKDREQRMNTSNDLKILALSAYIYASDNGGLLPDADKWCDQLVSVLGTNKEPSLHPYELERCLGRKRHCYAINSLAAGHRLDALESNTVVFLPVWKKGKNLSTTPQDINTLAWDEQGLLQVVDLSWEVRSLERPGRTKQ
jgi:hypothetical protein